MKLKTTEMFMKLACATLGFSQTASAADPNILGHSLIGSWPDILDKVWSSKFAHQLKRLSTKALGFGPL